MNPFSITWHDHEVQKDERISRHRQKPCILWFTGLSGSGKSTIANGVERQLFEQGALTYLLDGDNVRHGLNKDLGFDDVARHENIRRIAEVSKLFVDAGMIVLAAFIAPFREDREQARQLVDAHEFVEIFIDTPLSVCEQRDPKGLYQKARAGAISQFTGIDAPYEAPQQPDIHIKTDETDIEVSVRMIVNYLQEKGYIDAGSN